MSTSNTIAALAPLPADDPVAAAFDRARQRQGRVLIAALKPARLRRAPSILAAGADLVEVTGDLAPIAYALRQAPALALLPLALRVEGHPQPAHIAAHLPVPDVARALRGARHYVAVEAGAAGPTLLAALHSRLRLVRALTRLPVAVRDDGADAGRALALAGLADALLVDGDVADIAAIARGLARGRGHLRAVEAPPRP